MVATNELKEIITSKGLSQRKVAKKLGISEKTFYEKMKKGVFNSNEMDALIAILEIENPAKIFLRKKSLNKLQSKERIL